MKRLTVLTVLLAISGIAFAQASYFSGNAQTVQYINGQPATKPLPGASVLVCNYPGPCTVANVATIYTDATATVVAPNPLTADNSGNFGFWAAPGNYQYIFTYKGVTFGPFNATIGGATIGAIPKAYNLASVPLNPTPSDGTLYKILDNQRGYYQYDAAQARVRPINADVNVQDFGARGDGGTYSQTSCTSGSGTIGIVFVTYGRAPQSGDLFVQSGCGTSGADLTCSVSSYNAAAHTLVCGGGVTAGATLSNRGARWGASVDDTPAFSAAITYCSSLNPNNINNGCRIRVPPGVYFVSNLTMPAANGAGVGSQVSIHGVGRTASLIVGIGANQSAIISAPTNSVPTDVEFLGFTSYDYKNKTQIAENVLGGTEHTFSNNYATNVYEMVRWSNTWLNYLSNNRCYTATNCIHFGPGLGPVNASTVINNELSTFSNIGLLSDATGFGGTQQNTYMGNNCENTSPYQKCFQLNDTASNFFMGFLEVIAPSDPNGYYMEFTGSSNSIFIQQPPGCMHLAGNYNSLYANASNTANNCPALSYWVKSDGLYTKFHGVPTSAVSALNGGELFLVGGTGGAVGADLQTSALKSTPKVFGTTQDWTANRLDLTGIPWTSAQTSVTNPSYPNGFGTAASIPQNTVVINSLFGYAPSSPKDNNVGWICLSNPCPANPLAASDWRRWGEALSKIHQEATSAPSMTGWTAGDWLWKTNRSATTDPIGWSSNGGTWDAVYPSAVPSSCGTTTTCSNTAIGLARIIIGTVALTAGSATVTGISPAFSSTTSFFCTCSDTAGTAAACNAQNTSSSSITLKGSGTDTVTYHCIGN